VRSRTRVALVALVALPILLVPASTGTAAPPVITPVLTGTAGLNGWWVSNVTVSFNIIGATSSSGCDVRTLTTDGVHNEVVCSASGIDGSAQSNPIVRIDKTAPVVTGASPSRGPDSNGWYRAPVAVSFSGADATSGLAGCTQTSYGGPDSASTGVAGNCRDVAGNTSAAGGFALRYDATAPGITAALDRAPDSNGWYNHAVKLNVSGGDNLSGIASCDAPTYSGPDNGAASLTGSCTDAAGNGASQSVSFKYDATPPSLTKLAVASTNGAVTVSWAASPDTASVTLQRTPMTKNGKDRTVFQGKADRFVDRGLTNGLRYRYTLSGADIAGNVVTARTFAVPRALIKPTEGARLQRRYPPTLSWFPKAKATYYNVQVYRGSRKVLSAWPTTTKLKLNRAWKYNGRKVRFVPGRYRWYVWPGYGARKLNRYGKLHGGSFFFVR
jgi:hypothetical protein